MEAANLRKGSSSGGSGVVSLPEDIIFDVLTRLPAKVLCRFRCVCKGWRTLISDESFISAQKSRAAPLIAAVFRSPRKAQKFELRVMDMDGGVLRVFEGATGFLAPARHDDLIYVYRSRGGAIVIDPASGRVLTAIDEQIPRIGAPTTSCWILSSFGRSARSGSYKVLRIHQEQQGHHVRRCEIATIKEECAEPTWRQMALPPFGTIWSRSYRAYTNGTLYFVLRSTDGTPPGTNGGARIAAFNLESEEWEETIDGPAMGLKKAGETWCVSLTELNATLSIVQLVWPLRYKDDHGYCANIWILIDSKKSVWVKKYTIPMPRNAMLVKALDILGDGRILLLNGLDKRGQNGFSYRYVIQSYDPSTQAFTGFMEMTNDFESAMAFYTGSLLSLVLTNNRG